MTSDDLDLLTDDQEQRMRVTQIIADLHVPDVKAAKGFYTDYLGLTEEEFNLGWVARYTSPETGINLQLITRDATAPVDPVISVKVDDVEAAHSQAQQRGYEIVHPLTTEEWGVTRFFVRAPDGNVLNVVQHRD
jgi:catechol 2,3-dioxygenase-like lactoylglutathione lyase family enzyme